MLDTDNIKFQGEFPFCRLKFDHFVASNDESDFKQNMHDKQLYKFKQEVKSIYDKSKQIVIV